MENEFGEIVTPFEEWCADMQDTMNDFFNLNIISHHRWSRATDKIVKLVKEYGSYVFPETDIGTAA